MLGTGGLILTYLVKYASENEQSKKIFTRTNKDFEEMDKETKEYLKNEYPKIFGIK
jgi:hypothetical protein